jgi:hypothetical protein
MAPMTDPSPARISRLLAAVAATAVAVAVVAASGWYRSAHGRIALDRLSPEARQAIATDMLNISPGIYASAWFEPGIGYSLRPSAEITAWNDTFVSNRLGYRAGSPEKAPDVYRIVFVGDSWAYGMGVREEEAFPRVVERLANRHAALSRRVESWTLALPGYNALTEARALEYFLPVLEPDLVVLCPAGNDNHSYPRILPNGSPWVGWAGTDEFGDPHAIAYQTRRVDSHRYRARWGSALHELRRTEDHLTRHNVPLLYFFVAIWKPEMVHGLVTEGGLRSPYLIVPEKFNLGRWALPPPVSHATAEAHELYGFMVYQGLAALLGWPALPTRGDDSDLTLHRLPPPGTDWAAALAAALRRGAELDIPERFRPSPSAGRQCAGPIDGATGWMGRAATVLVRRAPAATRLVVTIEGFGGAPTLFPLSLLVSIPSASGGTRTEIVVPSHNTPRVAVEVPLPPDVPVGSAVDVVLTAGASVGVEGGLVPRSVRVVSIDQL